MLLSFFSSLFPLFHFLFHFEAYQNLIFCHFIHFQGARNVLSHYSKSIPQALQDLFPNMDIESAKFTVKKGGIISLPLIFFSRFVFLLLSSFLLLRESFGAEAIDLTYLIFIFFFFLSIFSFLADWSEVKQRKKLFESIAKAHSFDPLLAENWHKIPRHLILATPVCSPLSSLYLSILFCFFICEFIYF